jgi:alpha-N-arabinofuranosidase
MRRRALLRAGLLAAAGGAGVTVAWSAAGASTSDSKPVITVDAGHRLAPVSSGLTGVNANKWYDDERGLWDSEHDAPNTAVMDKLRRTGIGLIRYPGGTSANLFRWKHAIGPRDERRRQVNGQSTREPQDSRFGPDEFMTVMDELGAEPQIMANFASSSASEIADWVAYMNAPTGTRWGDLRAANGHPEPYGVRRWEIGNELHLGGERYWLSPDDPTALHQYVFGGKQRQHAQPVGTPYDQRRSACLSDGSAHQTFTVWYPPVVPHSHTIHVDGHAWKAVAKLSAAGAHDRVYALTHATGTIAFGDGHHGAIPPKGSKITADYDSGPHDGFVDYYDAMKKVDPSIEVVATWTPVSRGKLRGKPTFPQFMADNGVAHKYDGVSIHPYTNFVRDLKIDQFPSKAAGHDLHLLGERAAVQAVTELKAQVDKHAKKGAFVAVTECGALWFGDHEEKVYPHYAYTMSHVVYMASQWAHYANLGLAWVVCNDLMSDKPGVSRSVFGGTPGYVYSADAVARQQVRDMVHGGGAVVGNSISDNVEITTRHTDLGSSYRALAATATVAKDGTGYVMVVNRSAKTDIETTVKLTGLSHAGTADVFAVAGRSFDSYNSDADTDAVAITQSRRKFDGDAVRLTVGAHSVVLLRVAAA